MKIVDTEWIPLAPAAISCVVILSEHDSKATAFCAMIQLEESLSTEHVQPCLRNDNKTCVKQTVTDVLRKYAMQVSASLTEYK